MMIVTATAFAQVTGYPGPVTEPQISQRAQQNINQLFSDLQPTKVSAAVTKEQKKQLVTELAKDLNAMVDGATKPDAKTIDQLATDLAAAFDDGKLSNSDLRKVITDIDKILDNAGAPSTEMNALITEVQQILTAAGITRAEVDAIAKDLKAVVGVKKTPATH